MSTTRPMLFKGEMVRAILEGRKTQTRRLVPDWQVPSLTLDRKEYISVAQRHSRYGFGVFGATEEACMAEYNNGFKSCCPFGRPGDRLWVRETWFQKGQYVMPMWPEAEPEDATWNGKKEAAYAADEPNLHTSGVFGELHWRKRPSIHMPRWASRITLEITDVRVERLQDITEEDAKAEGAQLFPELPGKSPWGQDNRWSMEQPSSVDECLGSARSAFANFFCKLAGSSPRGIHNPRPWDANPWVWVIEFKRIEQEGSGDE